MRFRLLKPSERARLLALGLAIVGGLVLDVSCSGKPFTDGGTPSAGGSGGTAAGAGAAQGGNQAGESGNQAGESGNQAGEAGEAGSGGVPSGGRGGGTSSAGSAGKPPVGCDCVAGEYCQDGTNTCQKCADFKRFEFGQAQKLDTLAQTPGNIERFPRLSGTGSALFYTSGAADNSKILYAATPVSGVGVPVSSLTQVESGPLLVYGFTDQNLFFDRRHSGRRELRMLTWMAPPALSGDDARVDEPINTTDSDNYSIAISPNTGHVYWMSTRDGTPELLWQPTSMSAPPAPAVLDLKVKTSKGECARSGEDATPWVNLAGTLLLFRNPSLNDSCEVNDSGATDLFAAPLNKDGTPTAAATPLASLNRTGGMSKETDPSLSSDACTVYFASDNGTGDFDLYKAPRN